MSRVESGVPAAVRPEPSTGLVMLAVVRRPWGRRGELLLELHTDWPEQRFASGIELRFRRRDGREVCGVIETLRLTTSGPLLSLRGVDSISLAQPLTGATVIERVGALPRPYGVTLLHSDLTGVTLVDRDGVPLGVVERIDESPSALLLAVRRTDGEEVLVPFVSALCGEVDLETRRLTVTLPDGLLYPDRAEVAGGLTEWS